MNELQLSNDLTTIETEIKSYQNIAGQSIFEIGRRLKHVKENDLAHGEFGKWLQSINMHHDTANKMMKIANELNSNSYTYMNLGSRALYEIATLPEPERTKEHTTSNGETKTPDEMTVRELRELKTTQIIKTRQYFVRWDNLWPDINPSDLFCVILRVVRLSF